MYIITLNLNDPFKEKKKDVKLFLWGSNFWLFFFVVFFRQNPLWGSANTPLVRWLPAEYEDGETEPKGWNYDCLHNGFQLPAVIRNILH